MFPDSRDTRLKRDVFLTGTGLVACFFLGWVIVFWCVNWNSGALVWALACVAFGILGGFLFGIPRVTQEAPQSRNADKKDQGGGSDSINNASPMASSSVDGSGNESQYQVNTNLEQVSDWLTKIIVGLGLVELRRVDDYLVRASDFIRPSLGPAGSQGIAGGIIVYFSVLGFLGGYIMTRLFLSGAFARADRGMSAKEEQLIKKAELNIEGAADNLSANTAEVARKIATVPFKSVKMEEMLLWAKAKMMIGDVQDAMRGFGLLTQMYPNDLSYKLHYANVLFVSGNRSGALEQVEKAGGLITKDTTEKVIEDYYKAMTYYPLYLHPDGYMKTIKFAKEYETRPGGRLTGAMWVNLACAYGLQARRQPEKLQEAKDNALKAINKAIEEDKAWRGKLREFWNPAPDAEDNDLAVFKDDPEFKRLLEAPSGGA